MAPVVQTKTANGSTTTLTVTLSPAAVAGDPIVLIANSVNAVNLPAGFTLRASFVGDQGYYIWDKIAAGGETAIIVTQGAAGNFAVTAVELNKTEVASFDAASVVAGSSSATAVPMSALNVTDVDKDFVLAVLAFHGYTTAPVFSSSTNGFTATVTNTMAGVGATSIGNMVCQKDNVAAGPVGATTVTVSQIVTNIASFLIAYGKPSLVPVSSAENEFNRLVAGGFGPGSLRDMQNKELAANPTLSITDRRFAAWAGSGSMIEKSIAGSKYWVDVDY